MDDLGAPVSHLALQEGVPVYDAARRRIGVVDDVVSDEPTGIFEGLIIHTHPLPGRHLFAEPEQVAELRERGVRLAVAREALPELSAPSVRERRGDDGVESRLERYVRRAWDWLTGVR